MIGLTYTDTDGGSKYCYNSALATCRIRLSGGGITATELIATRRAMFEILTDTRNGAVPLLATNFSREQTQRSANPQDMAYLSVCSPRRRSAPGLQAERAANCVVNYRSTSWREPYA